MEPTLTLARRLWAAVEPIHAVVYFAPEPLEAARKTGLRGFWMSYFAGRVAPLGALPAPAVGAVTYGFAPSIVNRAIPDAWSFASPEAVLEARLTSAPEAVRNHADADLLSESVDELADLLWEAVAGCRFDGRPLAAGWASVPRPADPVTALWLAATVLREHRGDGHVLASVAHGLRGLDATVTFVATGAITRALVQPRGWTDEDWGQSSLRLRARGLLDSSGRLTEAGSALRRDVEDLTDRLAAGPVERVGPAGVERAIALAAPVSRSLMDAGLVPLPNPAGAPRP